LYRLGVVLLLFTGVFWAQTPAPASLEWQDRWDSYLHRTYSWQRVGMLGAETAFDQAFHLDKCGRPPYCFPHSFGGAMVGRITSTTIELGLGGLLKEDIRRRPSGLTGFHKRVVFALVHAPLARGPDGEWRPAYSRFVGTAGAFVVASEWAGRPITRNRMAQSFGWSLTDYFQEALFTEFEPDMKRFGTRLLKKCGWNQTRMSRTTSPDIPVSRTSKP
jgi:hypothetical protein